MKQKKKRGMKTRKTGQSRGKRGEWNEERGEERKEWKGMEEGEGEREKHPRILFPILKDP